jgi:DNA ligase-1
MLYSEIAAALQQISQASRAEKASLAADQISGVRLDNLPQVVRLLCGELWPSWEEREMGIGPQSILAALAEISDEDVLLLRERWKEMGLVAQAALQQKSQHSLSMEPLQAQSVYQRLLRISDARGEDSERRKSALLRGLFLEATPLEGKFIARTALRSMLVGIGPKILLTALALAFHLDLSDLQRAYSIMPEAGLVACVARQGDLQSVAIRPGTPVVPMMLRPGDAVLPGAFLPRYAGLRIQVHLAKGTPLVFTSQLRNITSTLNGSAIGVPSASQRGDWILDASLIGFQKGRICSTAEMMRHINRRRLSRMSIVTPAILAYDIIYRDGEDLTGLPYQERRRRLLSAFGEPASLPFQGISPAEERVLMDAESAEDYLHEVRTAGGKGLICRDLDSSYCPGGFADSDTLVGSER